MEQHMSIKLPTDVADILCKLKSNGYEAVVVGGCVRDSIMGKIPHDWDIATSALPEEILKIFDGERFVLSGLKHGTVTVIRNHIPYEITTYRIDGKYSDSRHPDSVTFTTDLKEDLSRRDFTINAMAYDGAFLYDYFGGKEDIEKEVIRCVGKAADRIAEDPLRILRALRFSAQFNFLMDLDLYALLKNDTVCSLLDKISVERKTSEFMKILDSEYKVPVLSVHRNVFESYLPYISRIKNWDETVEKMRNLPQIESLAILVEELNILPRAFCEELRLSNNIRKNIEEIIMCQKSLLYNSDICARELLSRYETENVISALEIKKRKIQLRKPSDEEKNTLLFSLDMLKNKVEKISENKKECYSIKNLAINGHDLKQLGVKDVEIGRWLNNMLDLVISEAAENNREFLLNIVKINIE